MHALLEILFNEWLVGFGVPILIGVGFTLLADEFKEYGAARWGFSISALWMCGKALMWSVFASDSFPVRAVIVFVVFGVVGIGLMEVLRLTDKRERQEELRVGTAVVSGAPPAVDISHAAVSASAYLQPEEPYAVGVPLAGIVWMKQYVDVRLDIASGSAQIKNLDFLVGLDTSIAGIGQISQFPGVTAFPVDEPAAAWLQGATASGAPVSIPMLPIPGTMRSAPIYRVHCSEVFSNTTVHFAIASIALNPPTVKGGLPAQLFAPRKPPTTIRVKGSYSTLDGSQHALEFFYRFPRSGPAPETATGEASKKGTEPTHQRVMAEEPMATAPTTPVQMPEPQAALQFTFWPVDPNTETLINETSLPLLNGVVTASFSAKSVGLDQAKNGKIWIQICDGCRFAEEPVGSEAPPGESIVRRKRFDAISPGVYFDPMTLKIIPPLEAEYFTIAFKYTCDQCPPINNKNPQKLKVRVLRPQD